MPLASLNWESEAESARPWRIDGCVLLLVGLGAILRLWLIWAGWCDRYVIADDAYYYFTIARNVAQGAGSTFDGIAPTNGYHPLYMLSLVPVFWLSKALHAGLWVPIHASLTLCAAFDLVTGLVLHRTMVRVGFHREAPWALAIWYLSPFTVLLCLRGLEGSLNVLVTAIWLAEVIRVFSLRMESATAAMRLGAIHG